MLETLCKEEYVVRFSGARYGLGPELDRLQRSFTKQVFPDQRVLLSSARLFGRVSRRVTVNGWYGSDIIIQCVRYHDWPIDIGVGFRDSMTSRCSTKAILAFVDEKRLLQHFASHLHPATTERTITEFGPFRSNLLEVAEQGYALDLAETLTGLYGIAAAFFTPSGFPLGSFGVAIPATEFSHDRERLIEAVRDAAVEASRALGYTGPYPPPSPLLRRQSRRAQAGRPSASSAAILPNTSAAASPLE